jgi:cell division protein FtsW
MRQVRSTGLGLAMLAVTTFIPYHWWRRAAVAVMGATLLLLILVLIVGDDVYGAKRTLLDGSIQPSEVAKLGTVIYGAAWLSSKGKQVRDVTYGLVPFALSLGVVAFLIVLQPDVSVAILIAGTGAAMLFFAGADILQLAAGGALGGGAFYLLISQLPHARERVSGFWLVWRDPTLVSHHLRHALIALGSGGLIGVGLGQGQQKLGYLPAPHTDSILAVIGEETGLFGCLLVLALFGLFAYRGFRLALSLTDSFAALLVCGITCWITFQATINIGVITGLLPFSGSALPFLSYGGSSMVATLSGVGLLLSISRSRLAKQPIRGGSRARAILDRRRGNRGTRVPGPRRDRSTVG